MWDVISRLDFSWWGLVTNTELVDGLSPKALDATIRINFKDGHSWTVGIRELSSIHHKITFEIIAVEPEGIVSAAIHSIALSRVTASKDTTFVEWTTDFSSDATLEVVTDASFKRKEGLEDLAKIIAASSPRSPMSSTPLPSSGPVGVFIKGVQGNWARMLNGGYRPSDKDCEGQPIYEKIERSYQDSGVTLEYNALVGEWEIKKGDSVVARCESMDPVRLPHELAGSRWRVDEDEGDFAVQPSVTVSVVSIEQLMR